MTQPRRAWDLEPEQLAREKDSSTGPGAGNQDEEAIAGKGQPAEGKATEPVPSPRVETARARRRRLGDALAGLESAVAAPSAADGWITSVSSELSQLRRALEEHIEATEGDQGLLEEIGEVAPRLSNEIASIESEHQELLDSLRTVEIALEDARAVRQRVMAVLNQLSLHRQRGADLVYEAYNVDIAAGD